MPGANDPDNRRMMQFGNYSPMQQDALDNMRSLAALRKNSMPLIYGDLVPLFVDNNVFVYERVYMGKWVIVVFNMSSEKRDVNVKEVLSGKEIILAIDGNDYKIISCDKCCGK